MPQRFLRPGITTSDAWNSVSFEAQSFYIRLLTLVDDFGRYDGRVPILHGQCFALRSDITLKRTAALRSELHDANLIHVYDVDSKEFIKIERWAERTRSEHSKFPDPPERTANPQESAAEGSKKTLPSPSPSSPPLANAIAFDLFWKAYPKKKAKEDAVSAWRKIRPDTYPAIMSAIEKGRRSDEWTKDAGKFIPYPASWLNGKRWEDEASDSSIKPSRINLPDNRPDDVMAACRAQAPKEED